MLLVFSVNAGINPHVHDLWLSHNNQLEMFDEEHD